MTVDVRRTTPTATDRLALAGLRRRWEEEDHGAPIDDPDFEARAVAWIADNDSHRLCWLAELAGHPVGMLTMVIVERMPHPGRPDSGWGYVHHLYVVPEHRDVGVGAQLLDAAIAEARSRGWGQLVLHPRPRSVPFYERAGFVPADLVVLHL